MAAGSLQGFFRQMTPIPIAQPRTAFANTAALLVLVAVLFLNGCTPVVRARTLPPSVRTVYIPMIENRTSEPGLEERITVAIQEEVLADGRLDIVRERSADAIVPITIRQVDIVPVTLDADGFGTLKEYRIEADFDILENIPGRPRIGDRRDLEVRYVFNDDPRSVNFNPEGREIDQLARVFAQRFVLELMTGEFDETIPTLVDIQRDADADRRRRDSRLDLP